MVTTSEKQNKVIRNSQTIAASTRDKCAETNIISLQNVGLILAQQEVFSELSFNFTRGMKVALLGESGVGKSSLLKLIAGIHQPSKGMVINNAQRIGYVFQEPRLLPWLTVEQNIVEVMKSYGIAKEVRATKLVALLAKVELSQYKDYYPHQLSGGMAQRVSLARAFAIEPDLLLLDEPFSALDGKLTRQLSQLLVDFLSNDISLIYVSHHLEQVLPLTQSCLVLKKAAQCQWHSIANSSEREIFLNKINQQKVF